MMSVNPVNQGSLQIALAATKILGVTVFIAGAMAGILAVISLLIAGAPWGTAFALGFTLSIGGVGFSATVAIVAGIILLSSYFVFSAFMLRRPGSSAGNN